LLRRAFKISSRISVSNGARVFVVLVVDVVTSTSDFFGATSLMIEDPSKMRRFSSVRGCAAPKDGGRCGEAGSVGAVVGTVGSVSLVRSSCSYNPQSVSNKGGKTPPPI